MTSAANGGDPVHEDDVVLEEVIGKIKVYAFPPDLRVVIGEFVKRELPTQLHYLNYLRHHATNYDSLWQRKYPRLNSYQVGVLKEEVNRLLIERLNEWHARQIAYDLPGLPER